MKSSFRKIFVLAMMLVFLVSGNGVVVAIHTCLMSAKKDVSLFENKSCCGGKETADCHDESKKPCELSSNCCSSEVIYHKISAPVVLPEKSPEILSTAFELFNTFSFPVLSEKTTSQYSFNQPPRSEDIPFVLHQLLI